MVVVYLMSSTLTPHDFEDDDFHEELTPGTKLLHGQYVIEKFLNNGGFGITYLAKDSLLRRVVIKECFPESICRRANSTVRVRSRNQAQAFRAIVDLFIEEARGLARLSHPNIVGVHQVFEDNDTAYMAMDYVEGRDMLSIAEGDETLAPKDVEQITLKLLDAVEFIHSEGMLHRDISPDNILLTHDNEPVLIDFGAARETLAQSSSRLGSMRTVKDGYSPQEFYAKDSDQHPSSDLYSLAASLYHVIAKELPVKAQARMSAIAGGEPDPYVSIHRFGAGYGDAFLDAIDHALKVFPRDRIQSAADWRQRLSGQEGAHTTRGTVSRPVLAVDGADLLAHLDAKAPASAASARPEKRISVRAERGVSMSPGAERDAITSQAQVARAMAPSSSMSSAKGLYLGVAAVALVAVVGAGALFTMGGEPTGPDEIQATVVETDTGNDDSVAALGEQEAEPEDVAARESKKPEQVPFFLAETSQGDVVVSSAQGTRLRATDTGPNPLAGPARAPSDSDNTAASQSEPSQPIANAAASDLSQAQTVETAPVQTAAAASEGGAIQDMSSVISAGSLRFPVVADASDPTVIASVEGPIAEQLKPGLRIVSINGFPIEALADFQRVVDATSDYTVGETVAVSLGVEDPSTGRASVRTVELPALLRTMLLNGVVFETAREDGTWVTVVSNGIGQGASDLRTGDRLIALMPENELFDEADALPRILERELNEGTTQFNFAVTRDGEMWLVTMPYATTAPGN